MKRSDSRISIWKETIKCSNILEKVQDHSLNYFQRREGNLWGKSRWFGYIFRNHLLNASNGKAFISPQFWRGKRRERKHELHTCTEPPDEEGKGQGRKSRLGGPSQALTFWTVVVRSKHSWMILFFVTDKSVIPVNGALKSKKYSLLKSGEGDGDGTPLGSRTMPTSKAPQQAGLSCVLCNHSSHVTHSQVSE